MHQDSHRMWHVSDERKAMLRLLLGISGVLWAMVVYAWWVMR